MDYIQHHRSKIVEALAGRLIAKRRAGAADYEALSAEFLDGYAAGLATPYFGTLRPSAQALLREQLGASVPSWVADAVELANRAYPGGQPVDPLGAPETRQELGGSQESGSAL
jgi:hypothetical protein